MFTIIQCIFILHGFLLGHIIDFCLALCQGICCFIRVYLFITLYNSFPCRLIGYCSILTIIHNLLCLSSSVWKIPDIQLIRRQCTA